MDEQKKRKDGTGETGSFRIPPAGESVVRHEGQPQEPPVERTIHRRRPLPLIPDSQDEHGDTDADTDREGD